jgi:C4-type Zn-finger protein
MSLRFCDDCGYAVAEVRVTFYPEPVPVRVITERHYCGHCLARRVRTGTLRSRGLAVISKAREVGDGVFSRAG